MRVFALLLVFSSIMASPGGGQQTPNAIPGFRAEGVYDLTSIDQVSLFNGQLTASIPIVSWPVSSHLSGSLQLSYSSSAWEVCGGGSAGCPAHRAYPKFQSNAGVGWRVSLGDLFRPMSGASGGTLPRWVYADASGSEHLLYPTLHFGEANEPGEPTGGLEYWNYTRDGSYIRVGCTNPGLATCTVEFPSGEQHVFSLVSGSYRISQLRDRFQNAILVTYPSAQEMRIKDTVSNAGTAREIRIQFETPDPAFPEQQRLIDWIDVPCAANSCPGGGTHARWDFSYQTKFGVFTPWALQQASTQLDVKVLTEVLLPDGSKYTMDAGGGYSPAQALMEEMVLPTKGKLQWTWASYAFPEIIRDDPGADPCPPEPVEDGFWTSVYGVSARRQLDRAGNPFGEWHYQRTETPHPGRYAEQWVVKARTPLGDISTHYFSIFPRELNACYVGVDPTALWGTRIWEYGMPYTRDPALQDSADTVQRFLSSRQYDCPDGYAGWIPETQCTLLRSQYQAFVIDAQPSGDSTWINGEINDRNRRLVSTKTSFHDDTVGGLKWKKQDYSNFDGLGHFRTTVSSGNFDAGARTATTNYNPTRGTYPGGTYVQVTTGTPWVMETFNYRGTSETLVDSCAEIPATQYSWEEFCFDAPTGFLKRQRTLSSSAAAGATLPANLPRTGNDVLRVFESNNPDPALSDGNVVFEGWYGGDDLPALPTPTTDVCALALIAPDFRQYHEYEYGTRKRTRFTDNDANVLTDPANLQHWLQNLTIDKFTGLATSSSDPSDLVTNFSYDKLRRLTESKPTVANGAASECYTYVTAGTSSAASVEHRSRPANNCTSGTVLREDFVYYDDLGRPARERRKSASTPYDARVTEYNSNGWRDFESEWGLDTDANVHRYGTESRSFDPFGRPREIRHLTDYAQDALLSTIVYTGDRKVARTVAVGSQYNGATGRVEEVNSTTTETYDEFGRLITVTEPSGASGAQVSTYYSYDVGNRLKRSETDPSGTLNDQVRCWDYDQRGFLASEDHPELAGSPHDVGYPTYDAMGHVRRKTLGTPSNPSELNYTYDAAARLTSITGSVDDGIAGTDPVLTLKEWVYATANVASPLNNKKAKVETAKGYNYPDFGSGNVSVLLSESFTYNQPGGRLGARQVDLTVGGGQWDRFSHAEQFDALGNRTSVTYPTCSAAAPGYCDTAQQQPLTVNSGFTSGFLTSITGYTAAATPISYHPNGLWKSVTHQNGVIDEQFLAADRRARPSRLKTRLGASEWWRSGTFVYDPAGNIRQLGLPATEGEANAIGRCDRFVYDPVQRLKRALMGVNYVSGSDFTCPGVNGFVEDVGSDESAMLPAAAGFSVDEQLYTFDVNGNITQVETIRNGYSGTVPLNTNGNTNRLTAAGATYDERGNLTSYSATFYQYDRFNRMTKRSSFEEPTYHFLYTADDERILTHEAGTTIFNFTLRDFGGQVLRDFENGSSGRRPVRSNIHRGGSLFAAVEYPSTGGAQTSHYGLDHLGTPRVKTDSTGQPAGAWSYFPFGQELGESKQADRMRFTGHERDFFNTAGTADDLDYMHARFHSPLTGRFLSVDPVLAVKRAMKRPQSWNRYAYVAGNPLKYVDPTGAVFKIAGCEAGSVAQCRAGKSLLNRMLGSDASKIAFSKDGTVSLNGVSAADFSKGGTFQKGLGKLIGDSNTFSLSIGQNAYTDKGGGAATKFLEGGGANIYVDARTFPRSTGDVEGTAFTAFAHEVGHAVGRSIYPDLYRQLNQTLGNSEYTRSFEPEGYTVNFENRYRREMGLGLRGSYKYGPDILDDRDVDLMP